MSELLAPLVVRAIKLAMWGLFVAVPTVITREPVARRIRAWGRPQALAVYGALALLSVFLLWLTPMRSSDGARLASGRVLFMYLAIYVAEALLFVRYVRAEESPGFVRARRRG